MPEPDSQESWLGHALQQAPWRTQTQSTSLVLSVVILVALIGALYLAQASRTAAAGRRVQDLEAQRQALAQENAQLRAEVAALRSVPRLIAEAERLGYRVASIDEVEYLDLPGVPPPPPVNPAELALVPGIEFAPVSTPSEEQSLPGWLRGQLGSASVSVRSFLATTFGIGAAPGPDEDQP